jgi:hypothetical protein
MRLFGEALLMTFTEVAPAHDADFSEWYNREHLDERINLPGFRRARRYEALRAPIRYLSTYEATHIDDIASPRYLELLRQQTEWSQRVIQRFTKWHRISGRVLLDATHGIGGYLVLLRWPMLVSEAGTLLRWLLEEAFPEILPRPAVLGACAVMADIQADDRLTRGLGQTPREGRIPECAILVEGTDPGAIEAAARELLLPGLARFAGAGEVPSLDTYRLLSVNQRLNEGDRA